MLVLTKKYELIEINIGRAILLVLIPVILIGAIAGYFTNIPDNINLALSIVLGILGTIIWELIREKRHKIFDDEGIELILTNISDNNEAYIKRVIVDFFKKLDNNKVILKLNKSGVIEEMELLFSLIQSSFPELKNKLRSADRVKQLYDKITAGAPLLTQEYGVNFGNLAFLYEMNTCYLYHNYSIGKLTDLTYELKNEDLLIQRSFIKELLIDDELFFNEKFKDHPLKSEYFELQKKYLYTFKDGSEDLDFIEQSTDKFINLFLKTIKDERLLTLTIFLAYDLQNIKNDVLNKNSPKTKSNFDKAQLDKIFKLSEEYIDKHEIFSFFYTAIHTKYEVYKDNFNRYEFSTLYDDFLYYLYKNELSRLIKIGSVNEYIEVYNEYSNLDDQKPKTITGKLLLKWYEYVSLRTEMDFSDITYEKLSDNEELDAWYQRDFNYQIKLLSMLSQADDDIKNNILKSIFPVVWSKSFFKNVPLYHFQQLKNFAKYLRD